MIAGWVRGLRSLPRRASFSIRFALVLFVLGILIAGATAAIPVQLAASETRSVALDRAADKGGIAANLVAAQRSALQTYISGVADQLEAPLGSGDIAGATAILLRQSTVTDSQDVIGASFGPMLRAGAPVGEGDTARAALQTAVAQHQPVALDIAATPWLVVQAPVAAQPGGMIFIARPMRSDFVDRLAADLGGGADATSLALIHGDQFVSGSTAAGGRVAGGARVPAAYAAAAQVAGGAMLTSVGGTDVAVSMRPLAGDIALLVTTAVSSGSDFLSSVVGPVAVIVVAMILIAMIVVFVVVQRDLQRPLRRLDRAVAALELEDFDVPIPRGGDDELGRLGRSFERMRNTMRSTLAAAEARATIAGELNAAQPLQTALQRVCTLLRSTTGAAAALIAVDHSDMSDAFLTSDGIENPDELDVERLLSGSGPINAALAETTTRPVQAAAVEGTEEARSGLRSFCVSPLRIGSNVLGALAVANRQERFNPADVALVAAAAEQVTLALERYRILAVVQRQASTDELTGLYNYRFLVDYLDQQIALAERLDSPLAVLMLDLDRFKALNDEHGHHAGDEALRRFAATLRDTVRRADLAARYGGEEFVVVMANTNREEARLVAEKIRRAVAAEELRFGDAVIRFTVSIGGVAYPDDTGDARQLLRLADEALYRAKRGGRDRVRFVSDGPRGRTLARAGAAESVESEADDERQITGHRPAQ